MSDPLIFDSASPRFGLPLLFPGQAQKEAFVNEAHALADALLHCVIEGTALTPPATPLDGQAWLVGEAASGEWTGQGGKLACRQGGNWLFIAPRDGMWLLDRSSGHYIRYAGTWKFPVRPSSPSGGTTVDVEARSAIVNLINALGAAGILPQV
ncbi:MAG: DUF2793 domain-containing protein [Sphingomonadales bacterium]|nr:DUF2793 domain-containing protein [Sphingomonadales bacterium]